MVQGIMRRESALSDVNNLFIRGVHLVMSLLCLYMY